MQTIYLDNAATSFPKPEGVSACMKRYMDSVGATINRSVYGAAQDAGLVTLRLRERLARLFSFPEKPTHAILTPGATAGLNFIFKGFLRPGDHCIVSAMEHNAVMRPLLQLSGVEFDRIPCDAEGKFDPADMLPLIRPNTRLCVLAHGSNVCGTVQDAAAVGAICAQHGIAFALDAAQTAGHIPIDFQALGLSALCAPGHKGLLGPHGTGALWVRNGVTLAPLRQGGTGSASESMFQPRMMPDSLESGTLNLPGIAGLDAGMRFALAHAREAHETTAALCGMMREALQNMTNVRVYTKEGASLLSFNVEGMASQVVAAALDEQNIAVRGGLHCAPGVHRFLGTLNIGAVRVSPGLMNTAAEAKKLIDAVWRIAKG